MAAKNLTSKRNVLIALTMLGFFVIVGIVSLFSVYALANSDVNSTIDVNYVTDNISATVSAKYWISGESKNNFSGGVNGKQYILADEDRSEVKSLTLPSNLVLTKTNDKVVFEFVFENTSDEVGFTVALSSSPVDSQKTNNIIEEYYVSNTEVSISNFDSISWQSTLSTQTVAAGNGTKKYVYIKAYIDEIVKDANYEGGFTWNLNHIEV